MVKHTQMMIHQAIYAHWKMPNVFWGFYAIGTLQQVKLLLLNDAKSKNTFSSKS